MCVREFLDRNSENSLKLGELETLLWPFFKKIFFANRKSLEFFNDEYVWTSRDWNSGEYSRLSLQEIIDFDKYLIKINGPKRYFDFTNEPR